MTAPLSGRIRSVPPSETLALAAKAAQLRAQGVKVISFAVGELDFDTPRPLVDSTVRALDRGLTRYAPPAGLPELRAKVAAWTSRRTGVPVADANVAVTTGAKQAIYNVLLSVLDPGDRVLVLAPYWVSYPAMVSLVGGVPVVVETARERGLKATAPEIAAAIAKEKPRAIILNSPSNPTGSLYAREELGAVIEECRAGGVFVISDEIYSTIVFGGRPHASVLGLAGGVGDSFCVVNGMSKSFAMTGWRVGWIVGSPDLAGAAAKVTAQTTSCATTFIQKGCADAMEGQEETQAGWLATLEQRRARILALLDGVPGVGVVPPDGAFYAWIDVSAFTGKRAPGGAVIDGSAALSAFLVEDAGLVAVPGVAFGGEGFLRFSFAVSMEEIEEGVGRFAKSLARLS